jgi:hypothetical protein
MGDPLSNVQSFGAMLTALEGVTVLAQPRVSRESIIEVLRDHTILLQNVKMELNNTTNMVKILASDAQDSRKALQSLESGFQGQKDEIDNLVSRNAVLVDSMAELRQEVEQLNELKFALKAQSAIVEDLTQRFESHKVDMHHYMEKTNDMFVQAESKTMDLEFQLKTLKDYVDHFGDNLVLASCQITVEASAGFSSRPISLLDVLKQCNGSLLDIDKSITTHAGLIETNTADILTKADAGICFEVENLGTRTKAIEKHLKSEEEQGVNAIRKMCEDLIVSVEGILSDLSDKVDRANVEVIVHKKYEDIVQFLSEALKASAADEENFKQKANELIDAMARLSNSKADRIEITPLQESLVKTEAMLTKFLAQNKAREAQERNQMDAFSKQEIEALLELKVNKEDFEQQIQMMLKGSKKKNKLAAMTGGVHDLTDDMAYSTQLPAPNGLVPGGGGQQLLSQSVGASPYSNPLLMQSNSTPQFQTVHVGGKGAKNAGKGYGDGYGQRASGGAYNAAQQAQQHAFARQQQQQMSPMQQQQLHQHQRQQQMTGGLDSGGSVQVPATDLELSSPMPGADPEGFGSGPEVDGGQYQSFGAPPGASVSQVMPVDAAGMPAFQPSQNMNGTSSALSRRMAPPVGNATQQLSQAVAGAHGTVPHSAATSVMAFPSNSPAHAGQFRQASEGGVAGGLSVAGMPAPIASDGKGGTLPPVGAEHPTGGPVEVVDPAGL